MHAQPLMDLNISLGEGFQAWGCACDLEGKDLSFLPSSTHKFTQPCASVPLFVVLQTISLRHTALSITDSSPGSKVGKIFSLLFVFPTSQEKSIWFVKGSTRGAVPLQLQGSSTCQLRGFPGAEWGRKALWGLHLCGRPQTPQVCFVCKANMHVGVCTSVQPVRCSRNFRPHIQHWKGVLEVNSILCFPITILTQQWNTLFEQKQPLEPSSTPWLREVTFSTDVETNAGEYVPCQRTLGLGAELWLGLPISVPEITLPSFLPSCAVNAVIFRTFVLVQDHGKHPGTQSLP